MRTVIDRIGAKRREEAGAVLVLTAMLLVVIFGFAALAVDAGYAFTQRRSSQYTADVAAVGAAVQTIGHEGTDAEKAADVVAEAQRLVDLNLDVADWSSCSDADALPFTWASELGGPSNCVSWTEGFRRVRVRVPTRNIETFFAPILGVDSIPVSASAVVEGLAEGLGGILPFGVLTDAGEGSLLCLKTTNGDKRIPPECEAPTSGDFGYLDFSVFGGVIPGADLDCASTGTPIYRLAENIAHGVDHELGIGPADETDSSVVLDALKCTQPATYAALPVNATDAKTGTSYTNVIFPGFVSGTTPPQSPQFPGRLTVTKGRTTTFGGISGVDDVALWEFLTAAADPCRGLPEDTAAPPQWGAITGDVDTEDELLSCMKYSAINDLGPIFDGLQDSPRFGAVPLLWKPWPPGGSENRTFKGFVTVYIQTLYGGKCDLPDGSCNITFEPGPTGIKRNMGSTSVDAVTAIAIPDELVTQDDLDALTELPEIEEYLIVE